MLIKFFLLNILCLHWTFRCVDFLLHFFFFSISHAVQLLDARRTKVCLLFAARLFHSAQPPLPLCLSVCLHPPLFPLLADAVILFTKPVHSFICKNKVLVCVYL